MERPRRDAALWHRNKRDATFPILPAALYNSPPHKTSLIPHYLRRPTPVRTTSAPKDYTRIVKRLYTMARVKGGMKFTCSHCAHHVSTLDFDARDGNLRTQAATAINRHATSVHHEPVMFSSLDTQQRIWRT
jgi:hypothetical protein